VNGIKPRSWQSNLGEETATLTGQVGRSRLAGQLEGKRIAFRSGRAEGNRK
jgi:hypothetical protein